MRTGVRWVLWWSPVYRVASSRFIGPHGRIILWGLESVGIVVDGCVVVFVALGCCGPLVGLLRGWCGCCGVLGRRWGRPFCWAQVVLVVFWFTSLVGLCLLRTRRCCVCDHPCWVVFAGDQCVCLSRCKNPARVLVCSHQNI